MSASGFEDFYAAGTISFGTFARQICEDAVRDSGLSEQQVAPLLNGKVCLSCGATQNIHGDLPCGH